MNLSLEYTKLHIWYEDDGMWFVYNIIDVPLGLYDSQYKNIALDHLKKDGMDNFKIRLEIEHKRTIY